MIVTSPLVNEDGRQHGQCRLGADRMQHFRVRVDAVDGEHFLQIFRGSRFELGDAVVRVTAVFRLGRFFGQLGDDARVRHLVRLADAHVDQFDVGMRFFRRRFRAFDLLEFIDIRVFTVVGAADPARELLLNKGRLVLFHAHSGHSSFSYRFGWTVLLLSQNYERKQTRPPWIFAPIICSNRRACP